MSDARDIRNLALIGFMGVGKSTTGQQVAAQLGFRFVDTDHLVEERAGCSISLIFEREGEDAFRALERRVVADLASQSGLVISTGGGVAVNPDNMASLKSHALVACLWAGPDAIWQRVSHQTHRPLIAGPEGRERLCALLAEREPFYKQADVLVNTELRSVKEVANQLVYQFKESRNGEGSA